ncbi:MAG TPA: CHAT domain-containing protein [Blastocatellia bacterium]|nr:CHAT domain-containing protein [Blastocatellia bacterium]
MGLCALLVVAFFWTVSWSSAVKNIRLGDRSEGALRPSDPLRGEAPIAAESRWAFEGSKGQQVTIAAQSYEFDIYLLLLDPQGRQITWADNNGGFFNARVRATLPAAGLYTVVVCGANADQYGSYSLSLDEGDREIDLDQGAAESFYREGIEWGERMASGRAIGWMNLGMAQYLRERGAGDAAEKYYARSAESAISSNFLYGRFAVALDHSRLFTRRRAYNQAVSKLEEALELSRQLKASADAETRVLIEFGNLYYSTARPGLATVYFKTATEQAEKSGQPSTLVELYTSVNEYLKLQDQERAIAYAEKAYSLCHGVDPVLELRAIHTLAGTRLFLEADRSQEGWALAGEMRDRARRLGIRDEEIAATTLMCMGKYATNHIGEMIDLAGEALELISPTDDNPGPLRIALQLKADGEMARGNYTAALQLCLKALRTVEDARAKESIEELRQQLSSQSKTICTQIIMNLYALNARHPSEEYAHQAFHFAERSRGRSLLEQLAMLERSNGVVPDLQVLSRDRELLEKISAVRGQLIMLRSTGYATRDTVYDLQRQRANLLAERMRLQAEIRRSTDNPVYAAELSPLTAEQVQKKLGEYKRKTVILYYQLGIQESFLIALTARRAQFFKLPSRVTITKAVTEWRAQVSSQLSNSQPTPEALYNYAQVSHQLYTMLMKPVAGLIKGSDLIIVPSGSLFQLAFEGLVVRRPDGPQQSRLYRYVVNDHAITYAPSISVLAEIENRRQLPKQLKRMLLAGDPLVEAKDNGASKDDRAALLDQLPAARQEVREIATLAQQHDSAPTVWLGPEASEDKFKKTDLSDFRFIHLATHAMSDNNDGEASAITLYRDPAGTDDGVLTATEIAQLKLNAELIVLSGCETASGQEAGAEGVIGLHRAFLVAGARCVCGSLWQVEDSWTQRLMLDFYRRLLAGGQSESQSLRLAKLKLLRSGATPFQWAPFIIVGSAR